MYINRKPSSFELIWISNNYNSWVCLCETVWQRFFCCKGKDATMNRFSYYKHMMFSKSLIQGWSRTFLNGVHKCYAYIWWNIKKYILYHFPCKAVAVHPFSMYCWSKKSVFSCQSHANVDLLCWMLQESFLLAAIFVTHNHQASVHNHLHKELLICVVRITNYNR